MATATDAAAQARADWSSIERELGCRSGGPINIGWHCSDRICEQGLAAKPALLWEDAQGARRSYTFDDLRVHSNTFARLLLGLGLRPGERVCIFMDRVPALYFSFLGVLKMGGIAQPLFSAFGEDSLKVRLADAGTVAVLTQRKHAGKVRRIRAVLPELKHVVVVDAGTTPLVEGETRLRPRCGAARRALRRLPVARGDALRPPLHLGHHRPPEGRAARPLLAPRPVLHDEARPRPATRRRLLVQRRPRLGDRHLLRHHRPLVERHHPGRARRGLRRRALVRLPRRAGASRSGTPRPPRSGC